MSIERLQKILAQAGIASRRKAEEMIEQGLVTVNGKPAKLGDKADFKVDHIKVDGKLLQKLEDPFYIVMNKPKGVISMMSDPEGRPCLADFLVKLKVRVNPIGRLDFNSDGLLLLTNDGAMAEKIQKSDAFPRTYHVKVKGHITTEMIDRLHRGMRAAHKFIKPLSVRIHEELNKKTKIEIAFMNAANVDVKTYFEEKGFLVEKITRTSIGHMTLHGLEPGQYRIVADTKFEALVTQPELGVRAINHRHEKEREILPRDQRMRNVDEHGKVIPKIGVVTSSSIRVTTKEEKEGDTKGLKRGLGASASGKDDKIIVRATGDEAGAGAKKKPSYGGIDMPKFKKRTSVGAGRTSEARGPREDGPRDSRSGSRGGARSDSRGGARGGARSDSRSSRGEGRDGGRSAGRGGFGGERSSGPRSERGGAGASRFGSRDKPRFSARDGDSRGGSRGGARDSRAPRGEGRGGFGGAPRGRPSTKVGARSGGPITRVKRKER